MCLILTFLGPHSLSHLQWFPHHILWQNGFLSSSLQYWYPAKASWQHCCTFCLWPWLMCFGHRMGVALTSVEDCQVPVPLGLLSLLAAIANCCSCDLQLRPQTKAMKGNCPYSCTTGECEITGFLVSITEYLWLPCSNWWLVQNSKHSPGPTSWCPL